MAKLKRQVVGSVYKAKEEGKVDYIKMRDGKTYRLESPAFQLKSLEGAVAAGKLSEEIAEKVRDRIQKIPDFVRFELVELIEEKKLMFIVGAKVMCLITGFVLVQFSEHGEPIPWQTTTEAIGIVKSTGPNKMVVDFSTYVKLNTKLTGDFSKYLVNQSECSGVE